MAKGRWPSSGRITDNRVRVDVANVLARLGVDVFDGENREAFDRGRGVAPWSDNEET